MARIYREDKTRCNENDIIGRQPHQMPIWNTSQEHSKRRITSLYNAPNQQTVKPNTEKLILLTLSC